MLRSMTGFGSGRAVVADDELVVEVKSVNHKFCEVKVRLPRELAALESSFVRRVKERFARGSLELTVKRSRSAGSGLVPVVDGALAQEYRRAFAQLAAATGLPDTTTVRDLAALPNVVRLEEPPVELANVAQGLETAVEQALAALEVMRAYEGQALAKDLLERLDLVSRSVGEIARGSKASVEEYQRRLSERIDELTRGLQVDPQRLAQEVAFFAERCDVAEELTRLASHVEQFKRLCAAPEPAGRKLDFLVQEMHREVNTTGSKSANATVTSLVVQLKAELERVREQVQNVE
ncbi:MAG: YicC family protein [Myxococcaceae bacterium]|nr:YicC family protein [Myxococcaceae bacterium]MCA3015639.1 YicC family protein [Myxococcaceae bacterium]